MAPPSFLGPFPPRDVDRHTSFLPHMLCAPPVSAFVPHLFSEENPSHLLSASQTPTHPQGPGGPQAECICMCVCTCMHVSAHAFVQVCMYIHACGHVCVCARTAVGSFSFERCMTPSHTSLVHSGLWRGKQTSSLRS